MLRKNLFSGFSVKIEHYFFRTAKYDILCVGELQIHSDDLCNIPSNAYHFHIVDSEDNLLVFNDFIYVH